MEERDAAYLKRCIESSKDIYAKFQQLFPAIYQQFSTISKRDDEEEDWEIFDEFWQSVRMNWMLVANGDAREILKPLRDSHKILTMASIHRKISMSSINMTNFASAVLALKRPDIYSVSRAVDDVNGAYENDAMYWNFPAATDVLRHLAVTYASEMDV